MKEKWEKEDFESLRTFSETVRKNDIFFSFTFEIFSTRNLYF